MPESLTIPRELHSEYHALLSETAYLLLRDADVDELCQTVFEILREPLQLDVYFHYLVNEDGSGLTLASSGGNDTVRAALGTPLAFGQAVCGTVAQTCEWAYVPGVQRRDDTMTSLIRSFGIQCYSCQPLLSSKGEILGTFSVGSRSRDEFNATELEVFRIVAQQITLATERRVRNRYMRQLEHQASAGRMCATLAHEINNPLEALSNILYLFRDQPLNEEGQQLLQTAESEVARLAETTQRTLDLFRGKQETTEKIDLSALLEEAASRVRTPKMVPIEPKLEDGLNVKGVPGELRQVFYNLLINAAHFSPSNTAIELKANRVNGHVEVRIKDEGPGIPEKMRRRLFQPFYTTRPEGGGTGLGLWVSHEIIHRAGGTLDFESNPDVRPGTTFVVTLPSA